jgi:site-specific DNA recombinase
VSEELFTAVDERLQENRKRSRQSQRGAKYVLQGLVVCSHCDYSFCGMPSGGGATRGKHTRGKHTSHRYVYYRCTSADAHRFDGERICHNKSVRTDLLDEAVWQDVCSLLANPQRIEREYQRRLKRNSRGSSIDDHLTARIQKITSCIARLVDA